MSDEPRQRESSEVEGGRRLRADAQRSVDALLSSAKAIFATSGVDASVRDIADRAGVGVGTLYRRFPRRADLIAAVFQREMDACADAAPLLATRYPPFEALAKWLQSYAAFVSTKRGLAEALHSGDPAFATLPERFEKRLRPAFHQLFNAAATAGEIRADVDGDEVLHTVASLCMAASSKEPGHVPRMVALLADGLRYGAEPTG